MLREADVPCSPVNTFADLTGDPDLAATLPRTEAMLDGYGAATALVNPLRVDGRFPAARLPAPRRGQHTVPVLSEAGYTEDEIDLLLRTGAAFTATP
jgi:formyl-CoA transferase